MLSNRREFNQRSASDDNMWMQFCIFLINRFHKQQHQTSYDVLTKTMAAVKWSCGGRWAKFQKWSIIMMDVFTEDTEICTSAPQTRMILIQCVMKTGVRGGKGVSDCIGTTFREHECRENYSRCKKNK